MGSIYKPKGRLKWMVATYINGKQVTRTAYADKKASQQLLAEWERSIARGEVGLVDPYAEHKNCPISEHLAAYLENLQGRGRGDQYISQMRAQLRRAFAEMGVACIGDIGRDRAERFLHKLRAEGKTAKTRDSYGDSLRQFGTFLEDMSRVEVNPFRWVRRVAKRDVASFERRALTTDSWTRSLSAFSSIGCSLLEPQHLAWGDREPRTGGRWFAQTTQSAWQETPPGQTSLLRGLGQSVGC